MRMICCTTLWRSKTKSRVDPKEYFKGKRLRSWSCKNVKHSEYNFLFIYHCIVCTQALHQQQCDDICILRTRISFLAKMVEFQNLKYSVLWILHPVRAENFISRVTFPELFTEKFNIKRNNLKRDEIVHFYFVQIPLKLNTWGCETKIPSQTSKFSFKFFSFIDVEF